MYLGLFAVIAVTPVALWCLRNHLLAGATVGGHHFHRMSRHQVMDSLQTAGQLMTTWLMPWLPAHRAQPLGVVLILGLAGVTIALSRAVMDRRRSSMGGPATHGHGTQAGGPVLRSATVIGLTYIVFVAVCGAGLDWRPEQRLLVPIYPFVMLVVVAGIEGARRLLPGPGGHRQAVGALAVVLGVLWLQHPARVLYGVTVHRVKDGAGGHAATVLQNSPMVAWLRERPLSGRVFSNVPETVYLLTGLAARPTPQSAYVLDPAEFTRGPAAPASYIVWFHALPQLWLYDLREILSGCQTEDVATFPDGGVYRYLGPGGPRVSAVYRFWSPTLSRHLYTIRKDERNRVLAYEAGTWDYEGPVFYAFAPEGPRPPDVRPVYQLSSARFQTRLYTMDEQERDRLLLEVAGAWTCDGVAFYAWLQAGEKNVLPVYRFWSEPLGEYFYTIRADDRDGLISESSDMWTYEGIAWYACGP